VLRLQSQGSIEQTTRPTDLAIEGEGFFQVQLPNARPPSRATGRSESPIPARSSPRKGTPSFQHQAAERRRQHHHLRDRLRHRHRGGDSKNTVEIGRLELARFVNPTGLEAKGQNLFADTPASGTAVVGFPGDDGMGTVMQGSLEGSNVEIVQEMVDMITAMRAYEINSKAIKNADDMMSMANGMVR